MWGRVIVGVVLCLVGITWFFQGIDVLKGSFMTGHAVWAVFGVIALLIGLALLRGAQRARGSRT
jgi:hypothetical protein